MPSHLDNLEKEMELLPQLPYLFVLGSSYLFFVLFFLLSSCGALWAIMRTWDITKRNLHGLFMACTTTVLALGTIWYPQHVLRSGLNSYQSPFILVLEAYAWIIFLAVTTCISLANSAKSTTTRRRLA